MLNVPLELAGLNDVVDGFILRLAAVVARSAAGADGSWRGQAFGKVAGRVKRLKGQNEEAGRRVDELRPVPARIEARHYLVYFLFAWDG